MEEALVLEMLQTGKTATWPAKNQLQESGEVVFSRYRVGAFEDLQN